MTSDQLFIGACIFMILVLTYTIGSLKVRIGKLEGK